jgi:hypothetical protein
VMGEPERRAAVQTRLAYFKKQARTHARGWGTDHRPRVGRQ